MGKTRRRQKGVSKKPKLGVLPSLLASSLNDKSRAIERNVKSDMDNLDISDISKIKTDEAQEKAIEFLTKYRAYREMGQNMPVVTKEGNVFDRKEADTCAMGQIKCGTFPRFIMPQIKDVDQFIKDANDLGIHLKKHKKTITVKSADELKAKIRPSQSEIMASNVADKVAKIAERGLDPKKLSIIVSKDGYIVDGHHTWNTLVNVLEANPKTVTFKVTVIEADILDILVAAAAVGIPNAPEYGWPGLLNREIPKLKKTSKHKQVGHHSNKTHKRRH